MLDLLVSLHLAALPHNVVIDGNQSLIAQSSGMLTPEKYQRLQQAVRDENPVDDKKPNVTYGTFAGILGFSGKLVNSSGGNETYQWIDGNRMVEGVFYNGAMVRWKGQGF
jgi:hypothetical protein